MNTEYGNKKLICKQNEKLSQLLDSFNSAYLVKDKSNILKQMLDTLISCHCQPMRDLPLTLKVAIYQLEKNADISLHCIKKMYNDIHILSMKSSL